MDGCEGVGRGRWTAGLWCCVGVGQGAGQRWLCLCLFSACVGAGGLAVLFVLFGFRLCWSLLLMMIILMLCTRQEEQHWRRGGAGAGRGAAGQRDAADAPPDVSLTGDLEWVCAGV